MTSGGRITVLLADQQALFREAVRNALEDNGVSVVAEARDGFDAVSQALATRPDVAFISADGPQYDGIRATEAMRKERIPTRIIILSDHEDLDLVMGALEAGACGFLTKDCGITQLIEAARSVHGGATLVPPTLLGPLLDRLFRRHHEQDQALRRIPRLTPRERVVLALLADGASNQGIAHSLGISPETARTHVQHLLSKLGVHSKLEAAAFVIQNGVLEELLQGDLELVPRRA